MPRQQRTRPISGRLRSSIRTHTPVRTGGVSPSSIKKLSVSMLRGYLASYKLPISGPKQQLIERLINHVRPRTTKERTRPVPQVESSDSNKSSPSGESALSNRPREQQTHSPTTSDQPSGGQENQSESSAHSSPRRRWRKNQRTTLTRSRKRHRTRSPPPHSYRDSSSESDSSLSPQRCKHRRDSSLTSASLRCRKRRHRARDSSLSSASSRHHKRRRKARDSSLSSASSRHHKRRRRARDSSLSSDSRQHKRRRSASDSSSTSSNSSTSTNYTHYYHRKRHRRCHTSSRASISCAPPLPSRLQDHIKRGKYVSFDKLLLPPNTPPIMTQTTHKKSKKERRQVTDITSWLEAWNRYLVCRIAYTPSMAVELAKYQTVMCLLFARYPPAACIEYDRLFRQAAAHDRSMRWDVPKEDIYVWALTQPASAVHGSQAFRDHCRMPISMRLGPPPKPSNSPGSKATHTSSGKEICKRINLIKCTKGDECVFAHVCWHRDCLGNHPGKGCPKQT